MTPIKVRNKEAHEKFFEKVAGTEEKARPFLEVYSELQDTKNKPKMDDVLKKFVGLFNTIDVAPELYSRNMLARYTEKQEPVLKSLGNNDF